MVGGPNGTTNGEEMILSFVSRGVFKVIRVLGRKKRVMLRPRIFRVTVPAAAGLPSEQNFLTIIDGPNRYRAK